MGNTPQNRRKLPTLRHEKAKRVRMENASEDVTVSINNTTSRLVAPLERIERSVNAFSQGFFYLRIMLRYTANIYNRFML